jgi:hypothetical protein
VRQVLQDAVARVEGVESAAVDIEAVMIQRHAPYRPCGAAVAGSTTTARMLFPGNGPVDLPPPEDCSQYEPVSYEYFQCVARNSEVDPDVCGSGQVDVPIALHTAEAISEKLMAKPPEGGTPTVATLTAAKTALSGAQHATHVVLITDGEPNCGSTKESTVAAIEALAAAGRKTYVIGVDIQGATVGVMNSFAVAGKPGETTYRAVSSTAQVAQSIRSLLTPVVCTP